MSIKTKTRTQGVINKENKIIFQSYEKVINKRMKAGKDVTQLTQRLNKLVTEAKK